jgi:hypothetical protein
VKLSINFILTLPIVIILIENPDFAKITSLYEVKNLLAIKLLLVLNMKMNFFEIFISGLSINFIETYFVKKYYMGEHSLGIEIKDKNYKREDVFKNNYLILYLGSIINTLWFVYNYEKLEFHLFDEGRFILN